MALDISSTVLETHCVSTCNTAHGSPQAEPVSSCAGVDLHRPAHAALAVGYVLLGVTAFGAMPIEYYRNPLLHLPQVDILVTIDLL